MNQASKEGAGGQHDATGADLFAVLGDDADTRAACIDDDVRDRLRTNFQVGLLGQQRLHGLPVELAVGLGSRAAHRRPLG